VRRMMRCSWLIDVAQLIFPCGAVSGNSGQVVREEPGACPARLTTEFVKPRRRVIALC